MDHEATHLQLKEHLRVLVDPKISEYRGHVVKNTGDGMLAEFSSVSHMTILRLKERHAAS